MTNICEWCQSILGDTSRERIHGICRECEAKRQQNLLDITRQLGGRDDQLVVLNLLASKSSPVNWLHDCGNE